jgi:UrcA family protein
MATLRHRLAAALETVCGSYLGATVEEADDITSCRVAAADQADEEIDKLQEGRAHKIASDVRRP